MKQIAAPGLRSFGATVLVCARQALDAGWLMAAGSRLPQFFKLGVLLLVWRSLAAGGAPLDGMTLPQLLTYTLLSSVLRDELEVVTTATSALWEGSIIGRFTRPMSVVASFAAETVGKTFVPSLLCYGLPVLLLAPLMGVSPLPFSAARGLLAFCSLLLAISIGFAFDLIFASFAMHLKNGCWIAHQIRGAFLSVLSGALIPFALLPEAVGQVLRLLPFGSMASAPLSIYVGLESAPPLLALQLAWNLVMWPLALWVFSRSREKMISFGG